MTRCSYLGLENDPTTALDFPSDGNFCHHALPAAPPNPAHQKAFCLSAQHVSCPVFLLAQKRPLPENTALIENKPVQPKTSISQFPVVLFLLIVATLVSFIAIAGRFSAARVLAESSTYLESAPTFAIFNQQCLIGRFIRPDDRSYRHVEFDQNCLPSSGWLGALYRHTH